MRLLGTKKLSLYLKDLLIKNKFSLVEHSFIHIKPISDQIRIANENLIFTSQNAVKIAFSNSKIKHLLEGKKYFCVGEKTKYILEKNGQKVTKKAQNSAELAHFLEKNYIFKPTKNDLIIFNSYLEHSVNNTNSKQTDRISLPFDLIF